ncbi:hypothetical protein LAZ67_1007595 [Cordylochernes scorpioides]|uniref:Probable arginine--tRNA ligase, mitochondrial n=1 Tax=Cordylochernes scorpioides TaxID=51811 RepID=A0ABY6K306_9ARAC|nr:hypothetical protein LAZ67_1007595 [Cordylochernes scorpioides]
MPKNEKYLWDGAVVFPYPPDKEAVLLKNDGSSVYLSRDIAAALDRKSRFNFDQMYYVSSEDNYWVPGMVFQKNKVQTMLRNLHHIKYGRIQGMSSRKGSIFSLSDTLNYGREIALKIIINSPNNRLNSNEEILRTADALAVTGLVVGDLKLHRGKDYVFNWQKALEFKGDSGLLLQYTHARLYR